MAITILMIIVLFASVAMLYNEGMWSNAIRLINIVTAALLAMNFYEPLASWMESQTPSYTYLCDFLALWGLFIIFSYIFRFLTGRLSQVKVKFLKLADRIGSGLLAFWIGWILVCFTLMSLNMAPLARNCLFGSFSTKTEDRMVLGFAPDRQWLGFTQRMSQGPYDILASEAELKAEKHVFDPHGEFLVKYATRRANLESQVQTSGTLRTSGAK